jgi:hypothetical protein
MCFCDTAGLKVPRQPVSRFDCGWLLALFADLALVDEALHIGVVDAPRHHLRARGSG